MTYFFSFVKVQAVCCMLTPSILTPPAQKAACVFFMAVIFLFLTGRGTAQASEGDIPPEWKYSFTPFSHVISVPLSSHPEIVGETLKAGDLVGVFYYDSVSGNELCGGFEAWNGQYNIAVVANGDDPTTDQKDGFWEGEPLVWKIYSMSSDTDYEAIATYDITLPQHDGLFVIDGLSALTALYAEVLTVEIWPLHDTVCIRSPLQLLSEVTGGSGFYSYAWTAEPPGFVSDEPSPYDLPDTTTRYILEVTTFNQTATDDTLVVVVPKPVKPSYIEASDTIVCLNDTDSITMEAIGGSGDTLFWFISQHGDMPLDTGIYFTIAPPDTTTSYSACWKNSCGWSDDAIITVHVITQGCYRHTINLNRGWGSISSYLLPENDSVEVILTPVADDLAIMLNMNQVYWPSQNINTIGSWDTHSGYKINMTRDTVLVITGTGLTDKTVTFQEGWAILPVLSSSGVPGAPLLDSLNDLIIVKEIAGNRIYWPQEGIFTLDTLQTGRAYMIDVAGFCSVEFP
jgi:hypothetical protein